MRDKTVIPNNNIELYEKFEAEAILGEKRRALHSQLNGFQMQSQDIFRTRNLGAGPSHLSFHNTATNIGHIMYMLDKKDKVSVIHSLSISLMELRNHIDREIITTLLGYLDRHAELTSEEKFDLAVALKETFLEGYEKLATSMQMVKKLEQEY